MNQSINQPSGGLVCTSNANGCTAFVNLCGYFFVNPQKSNGTLPIKRTHWYTSTADRKSCGTSLTPYPTLVGGEEIDMTTTVEVAQNVHEIVLTSAAPPSKYAHKRQIVDRWRTANLCLSQIHQGHLLWNFRQARTSR